MEDKVASVPKCLCQTSVDPKEEKILEDTEMFFRWKIFPLPTFWILVFIIYVNSIRYIARFKKKI